MFLFGLNISTAIISGVQEQWSRNEQDGLVWSRAANSDLIIFISYRYYHWLFFWLINELFSDVKTKEKQKNKCVEEHRMPTLDPDRSSRRGTRFKEIMCVNLSKAEMIVSASVCVSGGVHIGSVWTFTYIQYSICNNKLHLNTTTRCLQLSLYTSVWEYIPCSTPAGSPLYIISLIVQHLILNRMLIFMNRPGWSKGHCDPQITAWRRPANNTVVKLVLKQTSSSVL